MKFWRTIRSRLVAARVEGASVVEEGTHSYSPKQKKPGIGFLDLPQEIRDEIYTHLLAVEGEVPIICLKRPTNIKRLKQLNIHTSILRVCKQTQYEGEKYFYGRNVFFANLHVQWDSTRSFCSMQSFIQPKSDGPYMCLNQACSHDPIVEMRRLGDRGGRGRRESHSQKNRSHNSSCQNAWAKEVHLVRRLQIYVQPYSYSQFFELGSYYHLIGQHLSRLPICEHAEMYGLPPPASTQLQKLQVDIIPPGLLLSSEPIINSRWHFYPSHREIWERHFHQDLNRTLIWLRTYAAETTAAVEL